MKVLEKTLKKTLKNLLKFICYFESAFAITNLLSFPLGCKYKENLLNQKLMEPTISVFLSYVFIPQAINE